MGTEKTSLPSKEEFVKVKEEKQQHNNSIKEFSKENLKRADTQEKVNLPSKEDVEGEKKEQDLRKSVEGFDASKLKNCETVVKNPLPTKEIIEQEKAAK